jgi:altronate dehydratase large subunit
MAEETFLGYPRSDGSAGARNYVLVIPASFLGTKVAENVAGVKAMFTADGGGGRTPHDRETIARTFIGMAQNPNVAGVIIDPSTPGAGYPELYPDKMASEIAKTGKPVEILDPAELGGTMPALARGIDLARDMVYQASKIRRVPCPVSQLMMGVKCGGSDPTSGIAGNPSLGYMFDKIIALGGTALFGENTEIIGAEHILSKRGATPEVERRILQVAHDTEQRALSTGADIRTINPVPSNIRGGISSLEEKSLGAIHKAGSAPIQGVLEYAERPDGKGLYFVNNWMSASSIFPGYSASGTQLALFQLGGGGYRGRSVLSPSTAPVTPLIWCTANPITNARSKGSIDFYSGTVVEGQESIEEAGERLFRLVLDYASGTLTRSETLLYSEPFQVYTTDPMF